MRKQTKKKACSCALCKPHKTNGENRWNIKDRQQIKEADRLNQEYKRMDR